MIEYKTRASEAILFLSQNDMVSPAHHYMYVDSHYYNTVSLRDIMDTYQEYMFVKYKKNINLKLDETIPKEFNVTENMKLSKYILIKNTNRYHVMQGKYIYIPVVNEEEYILVVNS